MFDYKNLHRNIWLEIDLDAIKHNFTVMQDMVGEKVTVMPAIKANAYGHGVIQACKALEEVDVQVVAVGTIDEAIRLREAGVTTKIVIFASNLIEGVADLYIKYDLIPTVMYKFQAEAISKASTKEQEVFVAVETGRGRLGIASEECSALIKEISQLTNIKVTGLYSHMGYAGWDESKRWYPKWQHDRFQKVLQELEEAGIEVPFAQLVNTPGGVAYPDMRLTGMCPGRGLWGYSPLERREGHPDLRNALVAWKSRLLIVKEVWGGKLGPNYETVRLDKPKRIGIVCGGAADGISRKQANGGVVLINGKRVPICSPLSLEHTTVDLTNCPEAKAGDEVVIMGKQGNEEITLDELLELWDKVIPYFWTDIPEHVERVYYTNGKAKTIARGFEIESIKL